MSIFYEFLNISVVRVVNNETIFNMKISVVSIANGEIIFHVVSKINVVRDESFSSSLGNQRSQHSQR